MTHDELLDKIYWHWRKDPRGDGLQALTDYRRIILAVVRLHRCIEQTTGISYTSANGLEILETEKLCGYCSKDGFGKVYYPCKTTQTIEKELA